MWVQVGAGGCRGVQRPQRVQRAQGMMAGERGCRDAGGARARLQQRLEVDPLVAHALERVEGVADVLRVVGREGREGVHVPHGARLGQPAVAQRVAKEEQLPLRLRVLRLAARRRGGERAPQRFEGLLRARARGEGEGGVGDQTSSQVGVRVRMRAGARARARRMGAEHLHARRRGHRLLALAGGGASGVGRAQLLQRDPPTQFLHTARGGAVGGRVREGGRRWQRGGRRAGRRARRAS